MPIVPYPKCWRGRTDCDPFHALESTDADPATFTEEQINNLDYPVSGYICCGCVKEEARANPQDAYRLCFKTSRGIDDMTENDEQDLTHLMTVISHALSSIATSRMNSGSIRVLSNDGEMKPVATQQGQ